MHESFLSTATTTPYCDRNFTEWHGGISHYGFWAILVNDRCWLELLVAARLHMKDFIHPGNYRAAHITIAACGLLSEAHFSLRLREDQYAALDRAKLDPFLLRTGELDSFASAPYLSVEDPTSSIDQIRMIFSTIAEEDDPASYTPHITVGVYRDAFSTVRVANHLWAFRYAQIPALTVTEVAFCAFETHNIQGPFTVLRKVKLGRSCE